MTTASLVKRLYNLIMAYHINAVAPGIMESALIKVPLLIVISVSLIPSADHVDLPIIVQQSAFSPLAASSHVPLLDDAAYFDTCPGQMWLRFGGEGMPWSDVSPRCARGLRTCIETRAQTVTVCVDEHSLCVACRQMQLPAPSRALVFVVEARQRMTASWAAKGVAGGGPWALHKRIEIWVSTRLA